MNRSEFMKALGIAAIAASSGVSIADAAASENIEVAPGVTKETAEAIRARLDELFYPGGLITAEAFREAFMMVLLGRTLR
jgi:glycerol-3-phosphate responsive antiterminator